MRSAGLSRGLAAALLASAAIGAQAHKPSDAYLHLRVLDQGRVTQRLDMALRDLDRVLDLDADADGALRWGEVRARWSDIARFADEAVAVGADGAPCRTVALATPALERHLDGTYAVLERTLQCAGGPTALTVDYRLFARSDPTHRGIARIVTTEGVTHTQVLVPGAAPVSVDVGSNRGPQGFAGFFALGLHHILVGADHLLFLATLLLVAVWRRDGAAWVPHDTAGPAWREALRLVTAFTVAHSVTLGLAAAGVLAPSSRWVESLIAASVLVAALDNLRPFVPGPRWLTVAAFGFVHGFGFAGPMQDLGLRGRDLAMPLLGFNLGVEAGQIALVVLLLPLAQRLRAAPGYRRWIVQPGSAAVALLALLWTVERSLAMPLPTPGG